MKIANKAFFAFCLLVFFGSVFADGMVIDPDSYPYRQRSQEAFINYEDGKENLFIMVDLQDAVVSGTKTVWLFPVPAQPEQIEINNLKGFPALLGKEIKQQATENVFLLEGYMAAAAFPPLILLPLILLIGTASVGAPSMAAGEERGIAVPGLTIYQHIDKFGIATEVIKAQDAEIFKDYLGARGTNLSPEAAQFLQEYMGKNYSFIVSWISDMGAIQSDSDYGYYNRNPIGVFIKFPIEQIYYPLKPTAFYGKDTFPVTINIAGFKNADVFWNIKDGTITGHYYQKFLSRTIEEEETMKAIFNQKLPESLNYTRITISKQAQYFTEDLVFSPAESIPAHSINFFNQTWLLWMLLIFFGFAFAAIFLANRLLQLKLSNLDMGIIAAANFLTVFVAALAIALMKKEKFCLKAKEDGFAKKFVSLIAFEGIFFGFAVLLFAITIIALILAR